MAFVPTRPLGVVSLLPEERQVLLDLLSSLEPDDWDRDTECPEWSVRGIALHLLGDDLSLLSRQRDGEPPGVAVEATGAGWDDMSALDTFNERWVEAASFLSPAVLIELLRLAGAWTHRWYADVDPAERGEPIAWISPEPAPYWLLAAREYAERWVHQHQIRRAVNRPGLAEPRFVVPAVAVVLQGYPLALASFPAPAATAIAFCLDGAAAWTLRRDDHGWSVHDGQPADPTVRITMDLTTASALFTRGLERDIAQVRIHAEGDEGLGSALVAGMAAFFGR